MLRSRTRFHAAAPWMIALGLFSSCKARSGAAPSEGDPNSAAPKVTELPPLKVKSDTPNLLLTWIDDQGDFHVVDKPADVPEAARKTVRVVVTDKEAGTGEQVYVADLNQSGADGTYTTKTLSRAAWDELGATKRKARLEALAPSSASPPAPSASAAGPAVGSLIVVIYGADWCKPCHDAENYLKRKGVQVIKKDIEQNEAAAREMKQKLDRAGMGGASIPVIDVMGRILVGFSAQSLDRALEVARSTRL